MTDFPQTVIPRGMGRPPLKAGKKVKQTAVWLHQEMIDRITALVGKQGMSAFMREAAEAELRKREKSAKAQVAKPD